MNLLFVKATMSDWKQACFCLSLGGSIAFYKPFAQILFGNDSGLLLVDWLFTHQQLQKIENILRTIVFYDTLEILFHSNSLQKNCNLASHVFRGKELVFPSFSIFNANFYKKKKQCRFEKQLSMVSKTEWQDVNTQGPGSLISSKTNNYISSFQVLFMHGYTFSTGILLRLLEKNYFWP